MVLDKFHNVNQGEIARRFLSTSVKRIKVSVLTDDFYSLDGAPAVPEPDPRNGRPLASGGIGVGDEHRQQPDRRGI